MQRIVRLDPRRLKPALYTADAQAGGLRSTRVRIGVAENHRMGTTRNQHGLLADQEAVVSGRETRDP